MPLAWLTKSALPSSLAEYTITLPVDELWQADFFGALAALIDPFYWEQHGTLTPDEMADAWREILLNQFWNLPMAIPVGSILPFAGTVAPTNFMFPTGQSLLRADFPVLFGVIGVGYGAVDGLHFNLPNLVGRVVLGVSIGHALGTSGGEDSHALTIAELAAHSHIQDSHAHTSPAHAHTSPAHAHVVNSFDGSSITVFDGSPGSGSFGAATGTRATETFTNTQNTTPGDVGGLAVAVNGQVAINQNAGSGQAHNNLPPFLVVNYIIKVR